MSPVSVTLSRSRKSFSTGKTETRGRCHVRRPRKGRRSCGTHDGHVRKQRKNEVYRQTGRAELRGGEDRERSF